MRVFRLYAPIILGLVCAPVSADSGGPGMDAALIGLRDADLRLEAIVYRLARANAALCEMQAPLTGLIVAGRDDYRGAARQAADALFGVRDGVGVEAVVPGSPADVAGVRAGDRLLAVDDAPVGGRHARTRVLAVLAAERSAPILTLERAGARRRLALARVPGCPVHGQIRVSPGLNAGTDGSAIEIDSGLMNRIASDDAMASVVAHELAHAVLAHPRRLAAIGIDPAASHHDARATAIILGTERDADRLSVVLLANAGYDPGAAARYWLRYGPSLNDRGGAGATHPDWAARAAALTEAAAALAGMPRPIVPAWIAARDRPLGADAAVN